jgi:hypothetical protein
MTTVNVRKKSSPAVSTPSGDLVKEAARVITIETPNGLSVTLRKPGVLSQFRLAKILGEAARNQVYFGMVTPIIFVTSINGAAVNFPNSEREIEATIQRLDEDGVVAVMNAVSEHFGAETADAQKEAVKN